MIKSADLRIGNKVISRSKTGYEPAGIVTVGSIGSRGINSWQDMGASGEHIYEDLDGLPLTPELLTKCGFVSRHDEYLELDEICICAYDSGFILCEPQDYDPGLRLIGKPFFHVHRLQNLYHALSDGEELEIEL